MGSIKSTAAALAAAALLFAACAAEEQGSPGTSPGTDLPAETPGELPGGPGTGASPDLGNGASPELGTAASPDTATGASPGTGLATSPDPATGQVSPDPGTSPAVGASPGTEPSPAATAEPGAADVGALAVVDVAGSLTVLSDGQCQITPPDNGVEAGFGQPADGSTLQLAFADETGEDSLDLSIELSRGFPAPPPEESPSPELSPSPDLSPSPAASPGASPPPLISGEDILPFTVLPEQVQLTADLPDQEIGETNLLAGSVAPNGLNGYIVATTETGQLLTVNFVCAQQATETVEPGASPGASPEMSPAASPELSPDAGESPALEPSPSP